MPSEPMQALKGRVVTMDAADRVRDNAVLYLRGSRIAGIAAAGAPAPDGFEGVRVQPTGGSIYPGLIELHNHLSYDALGLWQVPKRYTNRDDWGSHPDYRKLISGPMTVLGKTAGYPEAVARYVECKGLFGGVTTSQGIALFSNAGIRKFYRGLMRNVEASEGPDMPAAHARIADVIAADASRFLALLKTASCLLLHLSEGTDQRARDHFAALRLADGTPAITDALAGIHCVALQAADYALMASRQAAMVWSPLSNLLLYGQTADVVAAKAAGMLIGLGSDWSPSGSKNLLGELKVALAHSRLHGDVFSPKEIVAMATRQAARILKWDSAIGSLEIGKRADLLVVQGVAKDPYLQLIEARESDLRLVMVDGIARLGTPSLMPDDPALETWRVAGRARRLDLRVADADPLSAHLSLRESVDRLQHGLASLPDLAAALEHPQPHLASAHTAPQWFLELDHEEPSGTSIRPRFADQPDAPVKLASATTMKAAQPLSQLLEPLELDPLTVADDATYLARLQAQMNLPAEMKAALAAIYA